MYDYIRENHSFHPQIGRRVRHDGTGKVGVIVAEPGPLSYRVHVKFDGADHASPCPPDSLEYVEESV